MKPVNKKGVDLGKVKDILTVIIQILTAISMAVGIFH